MKTENKNITEDDLIRELTEESQMSVACDLSASSENLQELVESEFSSVRVRTAVASNPACSIKTNLLLSDDEEVEVRIALVKKATHLCDPEGQSSKSEQKQENLELLRKLAADTELAVRETLAEEIKTCDFIPPEIAQTLARDVAESVAMPVLEYSPLLNDEDLLEIISSRPTTGILSSISKRPQVSEKVCDSIVATDNHEVIPSLLNNSNAQIREETLNRIVEGAKNNQSWQEALITRPKLPKNVSERIEQFISVELINHLYNSGHLNVDGAKQLMNRVKKRLSASRGDPAKPNTNSSKNEDDVDFENLNSKEEFLSQSIKNMNFDAVYAEIANKAKLKTVFVRRAIISKNPKVIASLCWKVGISAHLALMIQKQVAMIKEGNCLAPTKDGEFALSPNEMNWHLEVFGANRPCNIM